MVEEALDVEQHDPTLESGTMSSLDIMEKGEARIQARGVLSPADVTSR
jgi:hypothetical protein